MTAQLDFKPSALVDHAGPAPRKSRRGSETRQRTERMTLRLLPEQQKVAQALATELEKSSVQALILDALQPLISSDALARLAADPQSVHEFAADRGLSTAQALILQALQASTPAQAS